MNITIKKKIYAMSLILFCILSCNAYGKEQHYQTISIDLDGVLNNYTKYNENIIPDIRAGAKEFIVELHKKGYKLILFTNRKPLLASKWLIDNKLDKYFSDVTNIKPQAHIYIDDRALKFEGNYNETLNKIEKYKVYWKN